jgi:hypothetical protein
MEVDTKEISDKVRSLPWEKIHNQLWDNIDYNVLINVHGQLSTVNRVNRQFVTSIRNQIKVEYEF